MSEEHIASLNFILFAFYLQSLSQIKNSINSQLQSNVGMIYWLDLYLEKKKTKCVNIEFKFCKFCKKPNMII